MIGMCVHVLLHLHIRCARDRGQNSLVTGPLSGVGVTDTGNCLPFSLLLPFCLKGMMQEMMLKSGDFVSTSSVGSSALQVFMLIHRVLLPALWSFGGCLGSCVHEATRVLLVAAHVASWTHEWLIQHPIIPWENGPAFRLPSCPQPVWHTRALLEQPPCAKMVYFISKQ